MSFNDVLAQERRARLAAEGLLELKQNQLFAANAKLSQHALALSEEIVDKREEVAEVRHVAEDLRGQNDRAKEDLVQAHQAVDIAEQRLWNSVETIQDGFAVFDRDSRLVAANPAFLSIFDGLESVTPGIRYGEIVRLMADEGIVDIGARSRADWCVDMQERWDCNELEPRNIKLWNGQFVKLADRRADNGDTVSLGLNITDSMRREKQLSDARARAESANRAKSAFLAKMSHELRTPMNGVVGMADLLADTDLDEEQNLFVDTIKSSGEALLVLINDVLDFSKIEAEKLVLHLEPFDLEQTLNEVILLFHAAVHDKDVALLVDYDVHLPSRFIGDPGRVRQILTNLIGNAVKFTASGHVLTRVTGLVDGDSGEVRVHVTIVDTGPGIAADMVDHIFGEFNQVEDEKNRKFEGTGLGLAITRQLVGLMGGKVWVDSEPGEGSSFGFHITMAAPDGVSREAQAMPGWVTRMVMVGPADVAVEILCAQVAAAGLEVVRRAAGEMFSGAGAGAGAGAGLVAGDIVLVDGADGAVSAQLVAKLSGRGLSVPVFVLRPADASRPEFGANFVTPVSGSVDRKTLLAAVTASTAPRGEVVDGGGGHVAADGTAADTANTTVNIAESTDKTPAPEEHPMAQVPDADGALETVQARLGSAETVQTTGRGPDAADADGTEKVATAADGTHAPEEAPVSSVSDADSAPEAVPAQLDSVDIVQTTGRGLGPVDGGGRQAAADEMAADSADAGGTQNVSAETSKTPTPEMQLNAVGAPEPVKAQPALVDIVQTTGHRQDVAVGGGEGAAMQAQARKMRILAAEDNKTNRLVFSKLVRKLNIELEFAENGRIAVQKWQSFKPDLVFMDISMPEMDGKEATREIRALEALEADLHTPIVALTAHAMAGDDHEIMAAGLDHYLTKPLRKAAIFERIQDATPDGVAAVFDEDGPGISAGV